MKNTTRYAIAVMTLLMTFHSVTAKDKPERAKNPPQVVASQASASAVYKPGETAVFTIAVVGKDGAAVDGTMRVHVTLTQDGGKALAESQVLELSNEPATIEYTLKEPGFVRLTAIGRNWQGKLCYVKTFSVAACEPEKIEPATTMPEDFDAFWEKGRKALASIRLDLKQERVPHLSTDAYDIFKVSMANINDTRTYGYLLVPTSGKKTYPALVSVAPAGKGKPKEDYIAGRLNNISKNEAICLFLSVYDHELGQPKEYYRAFKSKDGGIRGATGVAEDYFFYRVILGTDRAITWLAQREDVDKTRVVYTGNSQGGGMGLVMAGLNPHITAANVNIPAMCDHLAYQVGRASGWPGVLSARYRRDMPPEKVTALAAMMPYFDAVNFARRIRVPMLMTLGFQDTTCPPSGAYAAYNLITAQKVIFCDPMAEHGVTAKMSAEIYPWTRTTLGLTK